MRYSRLFCLVAAIAVSFVAVDATAQQVPLPLLRRMQQPGVTNVDMEAVLEAVGPNMLQVINNSTNQPWRIAVRPQTKVEFTATAKPDFLRSGLIVTFDAEVDKRGMGKDKVRHLTLISLAQGQSLGVWPQGQAPQPDPTGVQDTPKAGKGRRQPFQGGACTVTGRISNMRGDKMSVSAGQTNINVEVADDATIDVKMSDLGFARKGDKVSIKAQAMVGQQGAAQATEVKITAAEPLGSGAEPVKRTKSAGRSRETKSKQPEDKAGGPNAK